MATTTETYKFRKGEKKRLDDIYFIQGLGGNDWWDHVGGVESEDIIITKNITITVIVKTE